MAIDQSIEQRLDRLRIWNITVGLILAAQAILIAVLTNSFSLPVTATFMDGPPGTSPVQYRHRLGCSSIPRDLCRRSTGDRITVHLSVVQA
jgi:hypothetical protein